MTAFLYYLLKASLCSFILFSYYHVALRNRLYHQWNRFYLLLAVVLSLLLPLMQFTVLFDQEEAGGAVRLLQGFKLADNYLEEFIVVENAYNSPELWMAGLYIAGSLFFLGSLVFSLHKIYRIVHSNPVQRLAGINFVNTSIEGTPFTFLGFVFWNKNISLDTPAGQQIFRHEVVHVEEKHTLDKLFMQVVLVFFWCNPVFWLIRKELQHIHEFIADKKSINGNDTAAFATMILQTVYPGRYPAIINPFFQTSIKRRMKMLIKNQKPGLTYTSRLVALPLMVATVLVFTVRMQEANAGKVTRDTLLPLNASVLQSETSLLQDTIPDRKKTITSVDVRKSIDKKVKELIITYTDGTIEKLTETEARERGLLNSNATGKSNSPVAESQQENKVKVKDIPAGSGAPLYLLEGKEITDEEMKKIEPNSIESVNVWKGATAVEKFGEKAKNGAVEINLKKGGPDSSTPVFERAEVPASIDQADWRRFLEVNTQPLLDAVSKEAPDGNYTVNVRFIINKDGSLSDIKALNDPGYRIAEHVLIMMKKAPRWKPAVQNGHAVRSYHTQPITFVITDGKKNSTVTRSDSN